MKTILFFLLCISAYSQTVTTNWVMGPPNLRVVEGKLYNIDKSKLWMDFKARVDNVSPGIVVIGRGYIGHESRGSLSEGVNLVDGREIALRHITNLVAVDDQVKGKAMKVGVWDGYGTTLQLWDAGEPYRLAVLKTNALARQNALAAPKTNALVK